MTENHISFAYVRIEFFHDDDGDDGVQVHNVVGHDDVVRMRKQRYECHEFIVKDRGLKIFALEGCEVDFVVVMCVMTALHGWYDAGERTYADVEFRR